MPTGNWISYTAAGVLFLCILLIPQFISDFAVHFFIMLFMYAALSQAWNWIGGYAGQISAGHVVFFGLGAYSTGISQQMWGWNPWLGVLLGVFVGVAFGALIGIPTFRTHGGYFVIATLAIGEIFFSLFMGWRWVGGGSGFFLSRLPNSIINFRFATKIGYFYVLMVIFVLAVAITIWLERSKIGYYLRAIKGDFEASRAIGINLQRYKLIAMMMSAGMTALIGGYWANYVLFIDPESVFMRDVSTRILLTTIVGGVGTVLGPIIGSIVITPLVEGTRMILGGTGTGFDMVIYGIIIMVIAVFQPEGIMGIWKSYKTKQRYKKQQTDAERMWHSRESETGKTALNGGGTDEPDSEN